MDFFSCSPARSLRMTVRLTSVTTLDCMSPWLQAASSHYEIWPTLKFSSHGAEQIVVHWISLQWSRSITLLTFWSSGYQAYIALWVNTSSFSVSTLLEFYYNISWLFQPKLEASPHDIFALAITSSAILYHSGLWILLRAAWLLPASTSLLWMTPQFLPEFRGHTCWLSI